MAKAHSLVQLQGSIGNVTFSRTPSGGTRAYLKSTNNRGQKWHRTQRDGWAGVSAHNFGGAALIGSAIYSDIRTAEAERACFTPYSHNRIARRIREYAVQSSKYYQFTGAAALQALRGLDLSHKGSPARLVSTLPIGPAHAPDHLLVRGLREAAAHIAPHGTAHLECKVSIRATQFQPAAFDFAEFKWQAAADRAQPEATESQWLPVDIIPAAGLQMPVPAVVTDRQNEDQPVFHFVFVQWRRRQARKRPTPLHEQAVIKFAAATLPQQMRSELEAFDQQQGTAIAPHHRRTRRYRPAPARAHARPHLKRAVPNIFLVARRR